MEAIGFGAIPRPSIKPIIIGKDDFRAESELQHLLSEEIRRRLAQCIDCYKSHNSLKEGELIAKANRQRNLYTAQNPFSLAIADYTFMHFKAKSDFHDEICYLLALDAIQQFFADPNSTNYPYLARRICIADLLRGLQEGYNLPCFRLLRSIWVADESNFLGSGVKSLLPMKSYADLVDTECVHFAVCGFMSKGRSMPVTVYTCDSIERIKARLILGKYLSNLFSGDILQDEMKKAGVSPPDMASGKIVFCDSTNPAISEEVDVCELSVADTDIERLFEKKSRSW